MGNPEIILRKMKKEDVINLKKGFENQGWHRSTELFESYFLDQKQKDRFVIVAEYEGFVAGYVTLLKHAKHGPFSEKKYPEISDFNVFIKYQNRGIGDKLLNHCEKIAYSFSKVITLGVGLHEGYGPAQRLYVKRGYIPDGSGVWYKDEPLAMNVSCKNNDDLVLYLSKRMTV